MKNILILCCLLIVTTTFAQLSTLKNITEKDGFIGIGTKTPDELLTVKGKIHTQEVLVDLNGAVAPDYVFEVYFEGTSEVKPDYTMRSLKEVATYIQTHHHLPGVPSAKEINSNGLALKEMNLILLEKIEELMLYTIEQQKQIDSLKEAINKSGE